LRREHQSRHGVEVGVLCECFQRSRSTTFAEPAEVHDRYSPHDRTWVLRYATYAGRRAAEDEPARRCAR
jgi:hypothetical protein